MSQNTRQARTGKTARHCQIEGTTSITITVIVQKYAHAALSNITEKRSNMLGIAMYYKYGKGNKIGKNTICAWTESLKGPANHYVNCNLRKYL